MSIPIPDGSVVITPMEVYREMQATHRAVQDVALKLDAALVETDRRLAAIDGPDGWRRDYEMRLRALERWRWTVVGITTVLSAGVGAGATLLSSSGH